jgi:hypothetical protein
MRWNGGSDDDGSWLLDEYGPERFWCSWCGGQNVRWDLGRHLEWHALQVGGEIGRIGGG